MQRYYERILGAVPLTDRFREGVNPHIDSSTSATTGEAPKKVHAKTLMTPATILNFM